MADTDFSDEDLDFDDGFDSDDDGDDLDSAAAFESPTGFDDESVLPLVAGVADDADESESVLLGALFLA